MVWRQQLHGVEQDRSESESPDDRVRRVEVDVGQDVGHRVVDDVPQARKAVHQQSNTLGCHSCEKVDIIALYRNDWYDIDDMILLISYDFTQLLKQVF